MEPERSRTRLRFRSGRPFQFGRVLGSRLSAGGVMRISTSTVCSRPASSFARVVKNSTFGYSMLELLSNRVIGVICGWLFPASFVSCRLLPVVSNQSVCAARVRVRFQLFATRLTKHRGVVAVELRLL